jgi:small conductance mechanosensitive channel
MYSWHRLLTAAIVVTVTLVFAKLVDKALSRRELAPEVATRYRTIRRAVTTAIVFVGVLSALLVIPQVRAIAGGILASSAVIGLIIGFAAQRTLGNAIAGILIAFSQPLRLGDTIVVDDVEGTVEEIGLTYTFIRTGDDTRFVIPNEKLASDTIRNLTIRSTEKSAEITVQIPLDQDLDVALEALRSETSGDVYVSSLGEKTAVVTMCESTPSLADADRLARDLRVRAHRRLRAAGVFA